MTVIRPTMISVGVLLLLFAVQADVEAAKEVQKPMKQEPEDGPRVRDPLFFFLLVGVIALSLVAVVALSVYDKFFYPYVQIIIAVIYFDVLTLCLCSRS